MSSNVRRTPAEMNEVLARQGSSIFVTQGTNGVAGTGSLQPRQKELATRQTKNGHQGGKGRGS